VLASMIDFSISYSGGSADTSTLKSLKALRAFRGLRPLRMISRNEELRIVVKALLSSIPSMGNVVMVCLLFTIIFAILGINFFKGSFFSCFAPESADFFDITNIFTQYVRKIFKILGLLQFWR
jgi:hypothetical protein